MIQISSFNHHFCFYLSTYFPLALTPPASNRGLSHTDRPPVSMQSFSIIHPFNIQSVSLQRGLGSLKSKSLGGGGGRSGEYIYIYIYLFKNFELKSHHQALQTHTNSFGWSVPPPLTGSCATLNRSVRYRDASISCGVGGLEVGSF